MSDESKLIVLDIASIAVLVLLALVVLVLVVFVVNGDLAWCYENYAPDRIIRCLWFENSVFGRLIQPSM